MHPKLATLAVCLAATSILIAAAAGTPAASKQRIAIWFKKGNFDAFVLTPRTSGPVLRDSGRASSCCWSRRFTQRDGQAIEIDDPLATFAGKRGTFAWRARIEWVNSGNGYVVGTGTWKIVRGTGAYKHLEGHGRVASISVGLNQGLTLRAEGLVDLGR
jgi:hypothetical protein